MDQADSLFAELVIEQNLASREQVAECTEIVRKATELGVVTTLADQLAGKGYISRADADRLLASIRGTAARPASIAGYEIIERIGTGATGVVYRARHRAMDRIVAIKVLRPSLSRDSVYVERFLREARTAARLNHPNVVQAIDAGVDQDYHYFVMEYIDGPTVGRRLRESGPLDEGDALRIVRDVAAALEHAQTAGIVHRDIKPDNIMLTAGGAVKLADLGIARSTAADSAVTLEGHAVGTPYYMSPEQARWQTDLDVRSDVYSLGATLYHMLTGSPPFAGEAPAVVLSKRLMEPPPDPRAKRREISVAAAGLVMLMMAREPAERPGSAADLLTVIDAARRGIPPPKPASTPRALKEKRPVKARSLERNAGPDRATHSVRDSRADHGSWASRPLHADRDRRADRGPSRAQQPQRERGRKSPALPVALALLAAGALAVIVIIALHALQGEPAIAPVRSQQVARAPKLPDDNGTPAPVNRAERPDTAPAQPDAVAPEPASAPPQPAPGPKPPPPKPDEPPAATEPKPPAPPPAATAPAEPPDPIAPQQIDSVRSHVKALLLERKYDDAKNALRELPQDDPRVQELVRDVSRIAAFWASLIERVTSLKPGDRIVIDGKPASFAGFKDGVIRYSMGQAEIGASLEKMSSGGIIDLMAAALLEGDDPRIGAAAFILYSPDGDGVQASDLLDALKTPGEDAPRYRRMAVDAVDATLWEREQKAAEAYAELEESIGKSIAQAPRLVQAFAEKYDDTRFCNERIADLAALAESFTAVKALTPWKGSFYLMVQRYTVWPEAVAYCEHLGGHLVTITSGDEQSFVGKLIKSGSGESSPLVWIGATDGDKEGEWKWITGEPWVFTAWAKGQPDDLRDAEDACHIGWADYRMEWYDTSQSNCIRFVCEWKRDHKFTGSELLELTGIVSRAAPPDSADFEKLLAKPVHVRKKAVPLHYAIAAVLNQAGVSYLWEESAKAIGADASQQLVHPDQREAPAHAALSAVLQPLKLGYVITDEGVRLKQGPGVDTFQPGEWDELFDGKTLDGWRTHREGFPGASPVSVENRSIILEPGRKRTSITWTGEFPNADYELLIDVTRVGGHRDLATTIFPVGDSFCTLAVGVSDRDIVGLELIDNRTCEVNETTAISPFRNGQRYRIRLLVKPSRVAVWIDERKVIDMVTAGHALTIRNEFQEMVPFTIYSYETKSAISRIALRRFSYRERK